MAWFGRLRRSLAVLFHRDSFDRDLSEEMQRHLEMQAEENAENGMSPDLARHAAQQRFGNVAVLKETSTETWGWGPLERLAHDLRYALRLLRRNPSFTVMAVAILALGSGANTAIFTVLNAMLLRPLPLHDPGQLLYLTEVNRQKGLEGGWVAPGNYLEWRDRSHLMQDIGAFVSSRTILTGAGEPVRLEAVGATASLLTTLGIQPIIGRTFGTAEDQPGKDTVVLISEGLWHSRFAARSDILGQPIVLDGKPRTVIGVLPSTVRLDLSTWDIWAPLALAPGARNAHNGFYLYAIGRMKPGVDLEHARAEMRAVGNSISRENGHLGLSGWEVVTERLSDRLVRRTRPQLLLLSVAVALLLLVACANVANLLLTRSAQRGHEIAVRAALGAGRRRIVRQLVTESLVLSLIAGAAGLLLAQWTVRLLYGWLPDDLQTGVFPTVDLRVLTFTLLVSAGTGLIFGLLPALRACRFELIESLKDSGRGITPGRGRLGGLLVVSEAAIAVVLLVGAGLLMRSFAHLLSIDMGFRPERVLTVQVPLSSKKYNDRAKVAFYEQALERVRALPGARSAAGAEVLPIEGKGANIEFAVEGRPWSGSGAFVGTRIVTPGYFETMGIPLLKGRGLDIQDDSKAPDVAVINETMASTCWPGEDPIGGRFRLNPRGNSPWITVIGVVHDVKHFGLDGKKWPEAYYPQRQTGWPSMRLVVRTAADPIALLPAIRDVIRGIDPAVPVAEVRSMDQVVADSVAPRKLSMVLVVSFAALALALASIGLYGVIAYSVTQRRHELGVRMALGAGRGDVLRMVGARGLLLTVVGLAAGIGASLAATRFLSDMLFGVTPIDPLTYASVAVILLFTASAAVYIPARRATRIDPMEALRYE
jgi:putative ABC transport system permease protein